jgi:hypothetical protein
VSAPYVAKIPCSSRSPELLCRRSFEFPPASLSGEKNSQKQQDCGKTATAVRLSSFQEEDFLAHTRISSSESDSIPDIVGFCKA